MRVTLQVVMVDKEGNLEEVQAKSHFRLTSSTWTKPQGSDAQWFTASIFKQYNLEKSFPAHYNSQCTRKHHDIETQLRVHIFSFKKTGSWDTLPSLRVCWGSGLLSVIQKCRDILGYWSSLVLIVGAWGSLCIYRLLYITSHHWFWL